MREFAVRRGLTGLLGLGLSFAEVSTVRAQEPAPALQVEGPVSPQTLQLATEKPRRASRPPRPPVDPVVRELRQARGILAGGILFTTLCAAGFGVFTYAFVQASEKFNNRAFAAGGALLSCTLASIAGIGVGASDLRAAKRRAGRVVWTGGLGLRF